MSPRRQKLQTASNKHSAIATKGSFAWAALADREEKKTCVLPDFLDSSYLLPPWLAAAQHPPPSRPLRAPRSSKWHRSRLCVMLPLQETKVPASAVPPGIRWKNRRITKL